MAIVTVDTVELSVEIDNLIGDTALNKKAVESYELMQQRFNIVTRRLLDKTRRKGAGTLAQSWKGVLFEPAKHGVVQFGVENPMPYAAIHDKGGEIRAKKKYLAIPLTAEAKDQGWPRDWQGPPLRFGVSKKGNALLFEPEEKKATKAKRKRKTRKRRSPGGTRPPVYGKPQYLLRTSVNIPATDYLDVATKESIDLIRAEVWG